MNFNTESSKRNMKMHKPMMRFAAIAALFATTAPFPSFAAENLIANGAFEDEGTYMPRISSRANGTYAYWSDGEGFNADPWTLTGYAGLCVQTSAFLVDMNFDIGAYAMFLRSGQASTAEQTITISQTGCYRLSFDYWAWQGHDSSTMTVEFIHGSTTNFVASLAPSTSSKSAQRFSVPVNVAETGSYTLRFSQPSSGNGGNIFDNVSFFRCGDMNLVKNGNFEEGAISGSNYTRIGGDGYSNPHWTGGAVADANNWMGLCAYNMGGFFTATYWNPGKHALFIRNTAASDTSLAQQDIAFDAPGLYRVSFTHYGWANSQSHFSTEVRIVHNGEANTIGAVDHYDACYGKAFASTCYAEIPEAGIYALQFSSPGNTTVATANLIDNVVVNRCGAPNLIQNGSFEAGGGGDVGNYTRSSASGFTNPYWTGSVSDNFGLAKPNVGFHVNDQSPHVMGKYALYFRSSSLFARQSFNVSEAGYYHLSFVHWGWNKGGIPTSLKVLQVKDGGATTNVCGSAEFTPTAASTYKVNNSTTYRYYEVSQFNGLVYIPEAGECVLSFTTLSGYGNTYATLIDNVAFVKYDADEFAAGDEAPLPVDMLPVSSDGSVVVPRAVYARRAIVESGQVVKLGAHVHSGYDPAFRRNNGTIVMDEFKVDTQYPKYVHSLGCIYGESSSGKLRVGKVVDAGTIGEANNPRFRLNATSGTAEYIVGAGGFSFLNNRRLANCNPYYAVEGTVRIDPYADYAVWENPFMSNNQAMWIFGSGVLTLGTTDYDDPTVARTVTFKGGIGTESGGIMNVEGMGTVVFRTTDGAGFKGTLNVKDTSTLMYDDTSNTAAGTVNVKSGATLKVARVSTLAIGSALVCEAGAILDLDVSLLDADVAAVTLNGFTPPESGCVTVKVRGRHGGGAQTLIGNLPEGVTKSNFALDKTGLPGNIALTEQDGALIIRPYGFMIIVK